MLKSDGLGEHDHIIDVLVELKDRLEQLENMVDHLVTSTSKRIMKLEERISTLEALNVGTERE